MKKYTAVQEIPKAIRKEFSEYSDLVAGLLFTRGLTTKDDAAKFLTPNWERDVRDPFDIFGMERAVERIFKALDANEKVLIYSDYDCDGIPGSVVLHDFFRKIGFENFTNYIPHRHDEGYGFHASVVEAAAEKGVGLIVTIDVGITDVEACQRAKELGVDVLVTDHHLPLEVDGKEVLPEAVAILNSKQKEDTYHDDMLCGAAVMFKLVQALLQKGREEGRFADIPEGWEKWLLDMAGISTITDMVPLVKENRALAYFGLQVMQRSRRTGLLALLQKVKVAQKTMSEDDIGFMVGPRINAASRMDHPLRAFELLTAGDDREAIDLAKYLDEINDRRKGLVGSMMKEARQKLANREVGDVLVVGSTRWHPGLLGLVAMKLVEIYERPVFVWGRGGGGEIKGSCRWDGNASVVDIMRKAEDGAFLQFGGHDGAGGFSAETESLHTLETELSRVYKTMKKDEEEKVLVFDKALTIDDVNWQTYEDLALFAPFGMGNAKPQFLFENVMVDSVKRFGKLREHLELGFRNTDGKKVSAIGFFAPEEYLSGELVQRGKAVDLVAVLEKSNYHKTPQLRLRIVGVFDSQ